jgi:uncharacterized protein (DUF362 family)
VKKVFLERFRDQSELQATISAALKWVDVNAIISANARVFIKPNLTWKKPTRGVTVTPIFLRAIVEALLPITPNITIGESEGGQASFRAEDAFEGHGLYELQERFNISVVNLSKVKHETVSTKVYGETVSVSLPSLLLNAVDVFLTVPVPKIHAMTGVSIGFKNQWGCLGDKMRVTQHPRFSSTVVAINKILRPKICICDGTYFLDYTGPMTGEAVPMNLVVAGDDVGATSLACCLIMRIDPFRIAHHRVALYDGHFPRSRSEIGFNKPPERFAERQFRLRRSLVNYIQLAAFKSAWLNRLGYDSVFADAIHEVLWFIRRNARIRSLLYGKYGTGEANRGGRAV